MLNQELDRQALAEAYRRDQRLCIDNVLEPDVASGLQALCAESVPFDYVYFLDGANRVVSAEEMAALDPERKASLTQALMQNARRGIGFLYCGYLLGRRERSENLSLLYEFLEFLNSPEMLGFLRDVSGRDDLVRADAQCTRYTAGQYLTRHRDDIAGQQRRLAYVFGFTRSWHPDWGGLLQFFEDDGTPRDAWEPAFNRLSLFDVRHVHSVSYVTPFAGDERLSITGWFYG